MIKNQEVFLLIVPLQAVFKLSSLQELNQDLSNQQYRFQFSKNEQVIGKTENIKIEPQQIKRYSFNAQSQIQGFVEGTQYYAYTFNPKKNITFVKLLKQDTQQTIFSWNIVFCYGLGHRKKQLKIFSHQSCVKEAKSRYLVNNDHFKFKQCINFGRNQAHLFYKVFVQNTIEQIIAIRRKIQVQDNSGLIDSKSVNTVRSSYIPCNDNQQQVTLQKFTIKYEQRTNTKRNIYQHNSDETKTRLSAKKKLLKVKPIIPLKRYDDQQENAMCETISLIVPKSPTQRFATHKQQDQFNEKLDSFLKQHPAQQQLGKNIFKLKNVVILLILIVIIFFVSKQIFGDSKEQRKSRKKYKSKIKSRKSKKRTK